MTLWVVACSRCRKAKVCQAGQKTTTCGHCGRTLELALLRKHLETPDMAQAQQAAGMLNAKLAGQLEAFDPGAVPPQPKAKPGDQAARARRVALELAARGPFGAQEFAAALAQAGLKAEPNDLLAKLVAAGILVEPRAGRYKAGPGA
jgi:hypothetical protein